MQNNEANQGTELNSSQEAAVMAGPGPYLVIAGAGTGKTNVVVRRICRLINEGVAPERILALTFTDKAATEMLDRVSLSIDSYHLELPIQTFNAFGESLLRRYAADIGLSRSFSTMSESARAVFLRERLDDLGLDYYAPLGNPDGLLNDVADYFSRLKQYVITTNEYTAFAKAMTGHDDASLLEKRKHIELASAFVAYQRLARQANMIDYDDQIYLVIELLRKRPNVLKELQATFDFVMVDEFQDTNFLQSQLVDMLVALHKNLMVVGDDDQSIYAWRGATLANILSFKDRYPKAKEITLRTNYRSGQQILDSAYALIQHNNPHRLEVRLSIDKRLEALGAGTSPTIMHFMTHDEELGWIAMDIARRIKEGASPGSIAILARRNLTVERLHSHLDYLGVVHVVAGKRQELYQEPVVRMIVEALRTIVNPNDNTSLYHTLTGPFFEVPSQQLATLSSQARHEHASMADIISKSKDESLALARKALDAIYGWRDRLSTASVGQLAYDVIESSGYKDYLYQRAASDQQAANAIIRLGELFSRMKEFERIALVPSAMQYIDALPVLQTAGETGRDDTLDLSSQAVNVLTIHKAKGLEWDTVYIADCTEGSLPMRQTSRGIQLPEGLLDDETNEADAHAAEERRLMYVAMTRAKRQLILTHADRHSSLSTRKKSRFLEEAFGDNADIRPNNSKGVPVLTGFTAVPTKVNTPPTTIIKDGVVSLSASQIEDYLVCPLNFYYRHILKVPQPPSAAADYGSLMHDLMEFMNRGLQEGSMPSLKAVLERLETNWPRSGHKSAKQRERLLKHSQERIRMLHRQLSGKGRVPLAVEESFSFALQEQRLIVKGRFDAVLPIGDGVEIVDYKSSATADTPEKAKSRASSSLQMTLYALAWQQLHNELPALVTLDFISTGQRGSLRKTQRSLDTLLGKLQAVADGIRNSEFPEGKDHTYCDHP